MGEHQGRPDADGISMKPNPNANPKLRAHAESCQRDSKGHFIPRTPEVPKMTPAAASRMPEPYWYRIAQEIVAERHPEMYDIRMERAPSGEVTETRPRVGSEAHRRTVEEGYRRTEQKRAQDYVDSNEVEAAAERRTLWVNLAKFVGFLILCAFVAWLFWTAPK